MTDVNPPDETGEELPAAPEPAEKVVFENPYREKPAITIVIQSWATPVMALLMLIVGLVGGFVARPWLEKSVASPTNPAALAAPTGTPASNDASRKQMMAGVIQQTVHFMGNENAPVTIIEFSDFQCPYCGLFARNTQDQLIKEYVDTGKVRFGYSHFAFLGQESLDAAAASECAGEQGKFWEYHDLLFSSQNGENQGAFKKENLVSFASQVGIDKDKFVTCVDSGKYSSLVQSQTNFAGSNGLSSTPSFLVDGYLIKGAQDITTFRQVIDSLLNNQ